jgi:hypothetical protein
MDGSGHATRDPAVVEAWRAAQLAEVAWRDAYGRVDAAVVVPLVLAGRPSLALPYSELSLARALAAASDVVVAACNPRFVTVGAIAHGAAIVAEDPDGVEFERTGLLAQELAKHPPSRRRLDTLLLRREHWWLVPRLIVDLGRPRDGRTVEPGAALLALGGSRLQVVPCELASRDPLRLMIPGSCGVRDPAAGAAADDPTYPPTGPEAGPHGSRPAAVLEHGADVPELERPWRRRWRGQLVGDRFETDQLERVEPQDRPLRLRQRLRVERRLERACREGLRAAGHG